MVNQWTPKPLDLGLSSIIAVGLPFLANILYFSTGALLPMVLYYGLAWGIVKWRRGSTGYFNEFKTMRPPSFFINVGIIIMSLVVAFFVRIVNPHPNAMGVILTALIWAPVNAATEQLLWIYIFEAWDLYPSEPKENGTKAWSFRIFGLLFFLIFVGMIHTLFWVNFLHTVDAGNVLGILFVLLTSVSGIMHIWVWRQSNQMIFTFIPHFLLNLFPLFWTGYSIVPYLLN